MITKGTLFHEIINLPQFWHKILQVDSQDLQYIRHPFGQNSKQYLIEFAPARETRSPVIIYYHGGGWRHGKPEMFKAKAKIFTRMGFRVFLPSYRRIPVFNSESIREDLFLAVNKVATILSLRGQTGRSLVLGGMSAGGHLAGLIAADNQRLLQASFPLDKLAGMLLLAPPLNLNKMPASPYLWALAGKRSSEQYNNANPFHFLDHFPDVPTLYFHGTSDGLVPYEAGESFIRDLQNRKKNQIEMHTLDGGTHLDAVSWVHQKNALRGKLVDWLDRF